MLLSSYARDLSPAERTDVHHISQQYVHWVSRHRAFCHTSSSIFAVHTQNQSMAAGTAFAISYTVRPLVILSGGFHLIAALHTVRPLSRYDGESRSVHCCLPVRLLAPPFT